MQNSTIEWCDDTFNPWHGCLKVSLGCQNCYAEVLSRRYGRNIWGPAKTTGRKMMSENYWNQPLRWNKQAEAAGVRRRVFCASMADVFEEHPDVEVPRQRLWKLIEATPWLDWLLLTKRPENIYHMLPIPWRFPSTRPDNVWYGTSVENQEEANRRIQELLFIPAKVRFLSCEPLLGPIDLGRAHMCGYYCDETAGHIDHPFWTPGIKPGIHWVIAGGESGAKARPMNPQWVRSLRDQCTAAGVAFHFKQWGEYQYAVDNSVTFHANGMPVYVRTGKKVAGRELDGRTWDEVPA